MLYLYEQKVMLQFVINKGKILLVVIYPNDVKNWSVEKLVVQSNLQFSGNASVTPLGRIWSPPVKELLKALTGADEYGRALWSWRAPTERRRRAHSFDQPVRASRVQLHLEEVRAAAATRNSLRTNGKAASVAAATARSVLLSHGPRRRSGRMPRVAFFTTIKSYLPCLRGPQRTVRFRIQIARE